MQICLRSQDRSKDKVPIVRLATEGGSRYGRYSDYNGRASMGCKIFHESYTYEDRRRWLWQKGLSHQKRRVPIVDSLACLLHHFFRKKKWIARHLGCYGRRT